ncbi:MAG: ABC transporter permease [Bacillaceae bacterium]
MKKYIEIMKMQMKMETAYLAWYWADMASSILRLVILYYFWMAIYQNQSDIQGMSFQSMMTYIVLATILEGYSQGIGNELAQDIKQGNLAIEFIRPYHYIAKLLSMDIGFKISRLIRNVLPIIIISALFLDFQAPKSIGVFLFFLLSSIFGMIIGSLLDLIIGVLSFWTINIWGLRVLREAIIRFFSGALIPLTLFPLWFQNMSMFLPFQSLVYVPVAIYTGTLPASSSTLVLVGMQVGWIILLSIIVSLMWKMAVRKVTIFGG